MTFKQVFVSLYWSHGFIHSSIYLSGKWFEPKGISYLFGLIVRVRLVFRTTIVVVTTTVNSLPKDYPHLDDHAKQIN